MTHIIGAGIAGLCLGEALDRLQHAWCIHEKEPVPGRFASGKNAGIIRTYESDPLIRAVTEASLGYYATEEPSFSRCGLIIRPWDVDYEQESLPRRMLSQGKGEGVWLDHNGTVEPEKVLARLAAARYAHGKILYGEDFQLVAEGRHVLNPHDSYVIAAGEHAIVTAARLKLSWQPQLIAHRRGLYEFSLSQKDELAGGPVEWDENSGAYWRYLPNGNVLATAGEQVPGRPESDLPDEAAIAILARQNAFLRRDNLVSWRSCNRVMPLDNRPYVGRDPVYSNLFWFAGLGGRGMSIAPGLAHGLAALISGHSVNPVSAAFLPARAT